MLFHENTLTAFKAVCRPVTNVLKKSPKTRYTRRRQVANFDQAVTEGNGALPTHSRPCFPDLIDRARYTLKPALKRTQLAGKLF